MTVAPMSPLSGTWSTTWITESKWRASIEGASATAPNGPAPIIPAQPAPAPYPCNGRYVTVRNNVIYDSNAGGISIGGYANESAAGDGRCCGGSAHVVIVNNALYNNSTKDQSGEFQIQYHSGEVQGNIFENNIVYAGTFNSWIYSFVPATSTYPSPPATVNWNLYFSAAGYAPGTSIDWAGVSSYKDYAAYQRATGEDADSGNANPLFVNLGATPSDFDIAASSPAVNAGSISLSCSVGWCDPAGSSPNSIYGKTDFIGNPRLSGASIDMGAIPSPLESPIR